MRTRRIFTVILSLMMIVTTMSPGVSAASVSSAAGNEVKAAASTSMPFTDVTEDDYYCESVLWAVEQGITSGTSAETFSPEDTCTRGQVVTFLWRAAGEPEPSTSENPFTDVSSDAYYYKAVLWAVEKGITSGVSETEFAPDSPCTRGQVVTFQWRSSDKPDPASGNNPFTDVSSDAYYYNAVLWAVEKKITSGVSATSFAPDSSCTRGQIVTFLFRQSEVEPSIADFTSEYTALFLDTAEEVLFTAKANTEGVYLYENNTRVSEMTDDGKNGDETANDGIYSCLYTVYSANGDSMLYSAADQDESVYSDTVSIEFFPVPTEESTAETQREMNSILTTLDTAEAAYQDSDGSIEYSDLTAVMNNAATIVSKLANEGEIYWYEVNEDNILIRLNSGLLFVYSPVVNGYDSSGTDVSLQVITCQPCLSMYEYPEKLEWADQVASEISSELTNVSYSSANNYDNDEVTLEQIKNFSTNQLIIWHGHGGFSSLLHSFLNTGEEFDWDAWCWDPSYCLDSLNGLVIDSDIGRAAITWSFVEKYCGDLSGSLLYLAACHSAHSTVLADSFLDKGAQAVVGNTDTIQIDYDLGLQKLTLETMKYVKICGDTADFYTLSEALEYAKSYLGSNDSIQFPGQGATTIILGGTRARNMRLATVIRAGNHAHFGTYEQDNDLTSSAEPIEWQILSVEGDKALLVSKYALDCQPYNTKITDVTWEACTLRKWLNSTFLNEAFSSSEQSRIPTTTVQNPDTYLGYDSSGDYVINNTGAGITKLKHHVSGGNTTQDQVFLLSIDEAKSLLGYEKDSNGEYPNMKASVTAYAEAQGATTAEHSTTADGKAACWWWLRSPASYYASSVYWSGYVGGAYDFYHTNYAVRPALWVNLAS